MSKHSIVSPQLMEIVMSLLLLLNIVSYANPPMQVNAADYGFNETDATTALQSAINSGAEKVIIPNMGKDWIINKTIVLKSNQEVYFEPGVNIVAKKGHFKGKSDSLFLVSNKQNITLQGYGATLRMQKDDYMGPDYEKAEWRMVLNIRSCINIQVLGLTLCDSGGDGIYLGINSGSHPYNENIVIRDVICDNNYRQGISVISVKNLLIENCIFKNTSGTAPMAGIDFEPNSAKNYLANCIIRNCQFENNERLGIALYFVNLDSSTADIGIKVENCRIKGTDVGIDVAGWKRNGPKGFVEITDCQIRQTTGAGIQVKCTAGLPGKIIFKNCTLEKTATTTDSPILTNIDEVEFINCKIKLNSPEHTVLVNGKANDYKLIYEGDKTFTYRAYEPRFFQKDTVLDEYISMKGEGLFLIYAEAGDNVILHVTCGKMGNYKDRFIFSILSPQKELIIQDEVVVGENKEINFTASENGIYILTAFSNRNAFGIKSNMPLGLELYSDSINFVSPSYDLYFWLPIGLTNTEIKIEGNRVGEQVKATLLNGEDVVVEEKDNISGIEPHTFRINRGALIKGEVWALRLEKASWGALKNVRVTVESSIIPVISFSKESVYDLTKEIHCE